MSVYSGKAPYKVEDPIVQIQAKAQTSMKEEALCAITFLGKYSPDESPDAPPNAELLEALGMILELATLAYKQYREKFVEYQLYLAQQARVPLAQADGDPGDPDEKIDPKLVN